MKKLALAVATASMISGAVQAAGHMPSEIKVGVALAFTGPLESMAPHMAAGAELAIKEVSDSGKLLGGATVTAVRGDTTCIDAAAATATVERLVTVEGVKGVMGAMCSGATGAALENVAMPNGMVMISPSATSPALTTTEDNGLFFRTAPSDARQAEVMADIILEKGIGLVAVTYTNNDYGKGLADAFEAAYTAKGGAVTINSPHEDGKADYSAEIGALASAGGNALVVAGYVDQGGSAIIRGALDQGAFDTFVLPDGMVGSKIEENFGSELDGSFGQLPDSAGDGKATFAAMAEGFDPSSAYSGEAYDAAALILLAMQAAESTDPNVYKTKIFDVANAPGEKIMPGQLGKALELLASGQDIDYEGASSVEMIGPGESSGSFREVVIEGGKVTTVSFR